MRTFDYKHLPAKLFDGKVGDVNVRLYEDKGKLDMLEQMYPQQLKQMRARAHVENVDASTRIEGLYADIERVRELCAGAEPKGETESQIAGYSKALEGIEERFEQTELSTSTVVGLYETLYGYRDLGRKSRYRKNDYMYVQVDGHPQAMPVSPVAAFETPLVFGGACDSLADAFDVQACSPLILAAVFTVDFLCIRPFEEGNGRIARLFSDLLLQKAGFGIARYVSVDRLIEKTAMDYYDALNACVDGWERGANDYEPYALYWLSIVHGAYQQLFDKFEMGLGSNVSKADRVRMFCRQVDGVITKRLIIETLEDVSEATIENALGKMVRDGELEKIGAGRGTAYRWCG